MDVIKKVFNDPVQFNTLYGDALSDLTKGYGFMLGFDNDPSDETSHHDLDVYMTCYALMPDVRAFKEYSTYFKEHVYKRLKKKVDSANGTKASLTYVDLATEVIIPVCTQWACEKIYGLELSKDESLEKELEDHFKNFLNIFGVVFNKGPVDKQKAKETSEALSRVIEDRIKRAKAEIHKKAQEGWSEFFTRVLLEYAIGRPLPASTNYSFLDQLIKANHSTIGRFPLVASLKSMKPFLEPLPDDKAFTRKIGKERLEQARLASNTLAFAVVAAVNYAQACLYVLDYYLTNPDRLKELQGKHEQDHAEFMKYCHEALRLNQPLFLSRRANLGEGKDMDLSGMKVKHNDIVYANLWTVHQTLPKEEFDVGKEGKMHSLYGVGFHRCPASKFVKEVSLTSPPIVVVDINHPDDARGMNTL
ncbi:hypothetical protein BDN72DRAFT_492607 [Pluteus cervinus]|uniref:Uncharacterized protein n=1 Tax=Pluteus cervinus TaxID=181527 RepID=A0ACD3AYF5_9AGAR|nr:hypothetical protein BDN72DRAFT_492607 [Pluteus cervinus]